MEKEYNAFIVEDLLRLREEISKREAEPAIREIIFKINSCLFKGYPRRGT